MNNIKNLELSERINQLVALTESLAKKHNKIALYGYGTIGRLLSPYLADKLVAIVDQKPVENLPYDIQVRTPDSLLTTDCDCIIVSVLGREEYILNYLKNELGLQTKIVTFSSTSLESNVRTPLPQDEYNKLFSLKGNFSGNRCFIIGNGPSLNKCDLTLLKNEYTFGVNSIFYKTREMGFKPTFYTVEDNHVIDDNLTEINQLDCQYKFFPYRYKDQISSSENVYFFNYDQGFFHQSSAYFCSPRFSFNAAKEIFAGQTVTYSNIQLASFLGFTEIYLIGMDFSYTVPASTDIINNTYLSNEADPNHFHPDYFGKGKKWHNPQLDRVLLNYIHAKEVLPYKGIKIINATVGGKLEIFQRVKYADLFN